MEKDIRHVGFDVDSEKIAVAVAEPGGEVRSLGAIPYTDESVRRLIKKLGPASRLRVCYEAGPHGYGLYWLLAKLGVWSPRRWCRGSRGIGGRPTDGMRRSWRGATGAAT